MQKTVWAGIIFIVVLIAVVWLAEPKPSSIPAYAAPTLLPGARVLGLGNTLLWQAPDTFVSFDGPQAALVNIRTGAETPLTAFSQRYMSTFATSNPMQISPDGKWLLWEGIDENTQKSAWCAATLDGKQVRYWPYDGDEWTKIAWRRDSQHWAAIYFRSGADKTAVIKQFDLNSPAVSNSTVTFPTTFTSPSALWTSPANRLTLASLISGAGTNDFYEFPSAFDSAPPQRTNYNLPAQPVQCAASPDGKHIAWLLYVVHNAPRHNLQERVATFLLHRQASYTWSIWVSPMGSASCHQISPDRANMGDGSYSSISWTPDSKRVCYEHDNSIWTIPAD